MKLRWIKLMCILLTLPFLFVAPAFATDTVDETVTVSFLFPVFDENGTMVSQETVSGNVSASLTVNEAAAILIPDLAKMAGLMRFEGWLSIGMDMSNETVVDGKTYVANYIRTFRVSANKFVSLKTLNVQFQINDKGVADVRDVRFVTTVNSLVDYQCAGFEIQFGEESFKITTKNAYTALSGDDRTPAEAFVAESNYFIALTVTNFPTNLPFSLRSFVQLQDGSFVYGEWNHSTAGIQ